MDRNEFSQIAKAIRSSYSREKVLPDKEAVELWYSMLKDLPYKHVADNLERHIKTSAFPPTIADLRNETQEEIAATETWVTEWCKVRHAMHDLGRYKTAQVMESFDNPITRKVVDSIGWQTLCDSTNAEADRADFRRAFQVEQRRAAALETLAPEVRERIEEMQRLKSPEVRDD